MNVRLAVVSLWAEDVPTTAHPYRDVIGLPLDSHHRDRPHFALGNGYLVFPNGKTVPAQNPTPAPFPVLAFAVDDHEVALQGLQAQGVALPWGVGSDADSRWEMFHDPAGHLVELVQFGRQG